MEALPDGSRKGKGSIGFAYLLPLDTTKETPGSNPVVLPFPDLAVPLFSYLSTLVLPFEQILPPTPTTEQTDTPYLLLHSRICSDHNAPAHPGDQPLPHPLAQKTIPHKTPPCCSRATPPQFRLIPTTAGDDGKFGQSPTPETRTPTHHTATHRVCHPPHRGSDSPRRCCISCSRERAVRLGRERWRRRRVSPLRTLQCCRLALWLSPGCAARASRGWLAGDAFRDVVRREVETATITRGSVEVSLGVVQPVICSVASAGGRAR